MLNLEQQSRVYTPKGNPSLSLNLPVLLSSFIGNALEFYDFVLCGLLMPQLAPLFFPSAHPLSSTLKGMAAYAVGFVVRPLGGILFGHIGDKYGRKHALSFSILGMAIATFLFALIPSHQEIGILAGITFVVLRIVQGVCIGGEVMGSALFALEHHAKKRPGLIGSIVAAAAMTGAFLASTISLPLIDTQVSDFGWRFAFIVGSLAGFIGYYVRRFLADTPEYVAATRTKKLATVPLKEAIQAYPKGALTVFAYAGIAGSLACTTMVFINSYCSTILNLDPALGLKLTALGMVAAIIMHPLFGMIVDRIGAKQFMQLFCVITFLAAFPTYILLSTKVYVLMIAGMLLAVMCYSGIAAAGYALVLLCFPPQCRYSGAAVSYNTAQALLGGTQPVIAYFLIAQTGTPLAPAFYISLLSLFCFIILSFFKLESDE